MRAKGSCLGWNRFISTKYTRTISDFRFSPWQDSLCLRNAFTTTLADALGLSWDCNYLPGLLEIGNLGTLVGHGRSGYHTERIRKRR